MEAQPSKTKIKKTIEGIKDIKQMVQLLIKKKDLNLESEKEEKQTMQEVSTLQLGVLVTKSQQDSALGKKPQEHLCEAWKKNKENKRKREEYSEEKDAEREN